MDLKAVFLRHIRKTLRKLEFWFTILIYPAIAAGYFYIKNSTTFHELTDKPHVWYLVVSLIFFVYIIFYVAFEVVEKKLRHKVQGDKLRIKQEQNQR